MDRGSLKEDLSAELSCTAATAAAAMDAAMGSSAAKASPHIALADILEFNEDGDSADIQEVGARAHMPAGAGSGANAVVAAQLMFRDGKYSGFDDDCTHLFDQLEIVSLSHNCFTSFAPFGNMSNLLQVCRPPRRWRATHHSRGLSFAHPQLNLNFNGIVSLDGIKVCARGCHCDPRLARHSDP